MSSNSTKSASLRHSSGWEKPYDDFPLNYHPPSGRLYKKIKGKRSYFGYATDWQAAVDKYLDEKDDLRAQVARDGLRHPDLLVPDNGTRPS